MSSFALDIDARMHQIVVLSDNHPEATHMVVWNILSSEGSGWDYAACGSLAVALACISALLIKGIKEESISVVSLA